MRRGSGWIVSVGTGLLILLPGMAAAHEMEAELQLATGLALIWLSIMGGILFAIMKESLRTVILFSLAVGLLVTFVVITPEPCRASGGPPVKHIRPHSFGPHSPLSSRLPHVDPLACRDLWGAISAPRNRNLPHATPPRPGSDNGRAGTSGACAT